jgi:hypothetical protein
LLLAHAFVPKLIEQLVPEDEEVFDGIYEDTTTGIGATRPITENGPTASVFDSLPARSVQEKLAEYVPLTWTPDKYAESVADGIGLST